MFSLPHWWLLAAEEEPRRTILEQLDKATRGKVFLMILGLIILVMIVSLLIWVGGWMTRRWMAARDEPREETRPPPIRPDDWADKPLVSLDEPPDETPPPTDMNSR